MIVLDIETSGLDPAENGLLSIGAVDFLRPSQTFYGECRIRQGEKIVNEALEVNGFSPEEAKSKQKVSTRELIKEFDTWLQSRNVKVVAGLHVAAFDVPFLVAKAGQCDVAIRLHKRSIDLHSLAYAKMLSLGRVIPLTDGWSVMDTDTIHPFCGLPKEPKPHNALSGAKWEAESFSRLIYGKGLFKSFARYEVPNYLSKKH